MTLLHLFFSLKRLRYRTKPISIIYYVIHKWKLKVCKVKKNVPDEIQPYIKRALLLIETQKDLVRYLLEAEYNTKYCPFEKHSLAKKLKWTGSLVEWVEFIYALHGAECFNDGKITLTDLFQALGELFGMEVKKFSRTFIDIKNRSKGDCTVFLDKLKKVLLHKIEEVERKYINRTKR